MYAGSSISPGVRFPLNRGMIQRLSIEPEWLKVQLDMPGRSQSALARFIDYFMARAAREVYEAAK